MQQLLKGQETRFAEGLRVMKSRLSTLHASLAKGPATALPGESPRHTESLRDTEAGCPGCDRGGLGIPGNGDDSIRIEALPAW